MIQALPLLPFIVFIPLLGVFFVLISKEDDNKTHNAFNVGIFTIVANLFLIGALLNEQGANGNTYHLVSSYQWLSLPEITISLGIDLWALLLIFAVHIAVLIGMLVSVNDLSWQKSKTVFTLLFLGMITGLFVAADIFSFCIFFEAMLIPLFMLIGMFGNLKRENTVFRLLIYNFIGALLLFTATIMIYNINGQNVYLEDVSDLLLKHKNVASFIWMAIFISFLSRIPIWPFHYWIASISSSVKNPLVFIIVNILPITSIYGFMRFLPEQPPAVISFFVTILEVISVISILFIALIGFIHKDFYYKVFSYLTVYYIMYLLSVLSQSEVVSLSISFSIYGCIIVASGLIVLRKYLDDEVTRLEGSLCGSLCSAPRLSFAFSYFILAAVGLPLSSLFLSNFIILSQLITSNVYFGVVVGFSMVLIAGMLLSEFSNLRDSSNLHTEASCCIPDISKEFFFTMLFIVFLLFLSLVNPLWFLG